MNQIGYLITRSGRYYKDNIAIIDNEQIYSFKEVNENSNAIARGLLSLGLEKGDRVAVLLKNSANFVFCDFSLAKSGLVRVPINPKLKENEIEYILKDVEAKAIIFDSSFREIIKKIKDSLTHLEYIIQSNTDLNDEQPSLQRWISTRCKKDIIVETNDNDPYQILYTSGTTGKPKGAVISYRSRLETINNVFSDELEIKPHDRMLHVASLAHGSGSKVLPHFIKGAANVFIHKFSPEIFFEVVEKHKINNTFLVPTIIGMLLDYENRFNYNIHSLKNILYSASPMPKEMLKKAIEFFGPVLVQVYALTEAPNPVLVLPKREHLLLEDNDKLLESTGREVTNVQVKIVNDAGEETVEEEVGELVVRGNNVMSGYWKRERDTQETIKDGWLYTGDLGFIDNNGYFYIVGRKKDMIISGGYNVYSREVEDAIYEIAGVKEVAVAGIPDEIWGEAVSAFIVLENDNNLSVEQIKNHCKRCLANYKNPKNITIVAELPKNANGKVDKNKLKEIYQQQI
ncbi:acyl-CoA synthetase (AMP-forming)/AMP-acid ligase II [Salirhabdus euzebyi]|uniref:Acyl-CoA synthetase (AMP-forming)/AMP-acid ligase II n=1 Tax=Salirhabdus euzebyi TaxID=394506 RepID=A0A841Q865_9BACI|nr:long-chain-fatty-acid--CoA ligase [Salirhabdus euzebyi]MBB6454575.1 acyl-CoA synthetase (AMP-forming)/AMP-acid ligase II [Salirhabdus euzebyi]